MNPLSPPPSSPARLPAGPARVGLTRREIRPRHSLTPRARKALGLQRRHDDHDPGLQEREHLAQLLHDQLGGVLVQLRLAYGAWRDEAVSPGRPSDAGPRFDALLSDLSGAVRRLTTALAPPEWHEELVPALHAIAAELGLRSGLQVTFDADAADGLGEAPATLRALVCRVVRELGLNAMKHARASRLDIRVTVIGGRLRVHVTDDGVGLSVSAAGPRDGWGLRSARAQLRAVDGSLVLTSTPGRGTRATLTVPLLPQGAVVPAWQDDSSQGA
ncbi:MAG: hypothetical protein EOP35_01615 [Rubrivivax sp.]|nr:MAG: hypothetical protein EOP35_01615 [Rubrivivax sp.]